MIKYLSFLILFFLARFAKFCLKQFSLCKRATEMSKSQVPNMTLVQSTPSFG